MKSPSRPGSETGVKGGSVPTTACPGRHRRHTAGARLEHMHRKTSTAAAAAAAAWMQ